MLHRKIAGVGGRRHGHTFRWICVGVATNDGPRGNQSDDEKYSGGGHRERLRAAATAPAFAATHDCSHQTTSALLPASPQLRQLTSQMLVMTAAASRQRTRFFCGCCTAAPCGGNGRRCADQRRDVPTQHLGHTVGRKSHCQMKREAF